MQGSERLWNVLEGSKGLYMAMAGFGMFCQKPSWSAPARSGTSRSCRSSPPPGHRSPAVTQGEESFQDRLWQAGRFKSRPPLLPLGFLVESTYPHFAKAKSQDSCRSSPLLGLRSPAVLGLGFGGWGSRSRIQAKSNDIEDSGRLWRALECH